MDQNENQPPAPLPQGDLQEQVDRLHQLVHSILILAIVVSGTFAVYLFNQLRYARKDHAQIKNAWAQYLKNTGTPTDEFLKKLTAFSKTHPDYQPIALKYGLLTNAPGTNATAPSKPAPAAPPVKK